MDDSRFGFAAGFRLAGIEAAVVVDQGSLRAMPPALRLQSVYFICDGARVEVKVVAEDGVSGLDNSLSALLP